MDKLKTYVEILLKYAKTSPENAGKYFNQAFGACQYFLFEYPAMQILLENMWNEYKPQFEALIYGKY